MSQIAIGITTYGQNEDGKFDLPREYVDSVQRAGCVPVLLPPVGLAIDRLLAMVDGLILTGGGDLCPSHYGGPEHEALYGVDAERDAYELQLATALVEREIPTLAICRGVQVLNVVRGGTLHLHLPDVVGDDIAHRAPPRDPTDHPLRVHEGSRLAAICEQTEFVAASWHHQAICDLGNGLVAVAHASDGTIEGVEMPSHPWMFGVQWHPELTSATDPIQQQLFDRLADASRERREKQA